MKKGEEREASSREGIRISIYHKLRGLWEESSPDITGRRARKREPRSMLDKNIRRGREKRGKRGRGRKRMRCWANEEETRGLSSGIKTCKPRAVSSSSSRRKPASRAIHPEFINLEEMNFIQFKILCIRRCFPYNFVKLSLIFLHLELDLELG